MKLLNKTKRKELTRIRQKQILDAAAQVFSKKGFAVTQVDEIADLAGLGKGTVYRYFKDKKKLFLSVADKSIENVTDLALEAMAKEKEPSDKIEKAIKAYLGFFEKHSNLIGILIHEQSEFQKRIQKRYFERYYEHINKMEAVFKQGIAKGQIKKIDVRGAIAVLTNMLNGLIYMWGFEGKKGCLQDKTSLILKIFFTGIIKDDGRRKKYEK
jgi:AcrR family transcriptional regulator